LATVGVCAAAALVLAACQGDPQPGSAAAGAPSTVATAQTTTSTPSTDKSSGKPTSAGTLTTKAPQPAALPDDPRNISIIVGGDVLLHGGLTDQAKTDAAANPAQATHGLDYYPLLAGAKPFLAKADLALCNLETPLAPIGGPYSGYPVFTVPQDILPALTDAGVDACTTASNHSIDAGFTGITRTLDAMDAAGLRHIGSSRSAAEAASPLILEAKGVKIAVLAAAYGLNGFQLPADKPWAVNIIDADKLIAQAKAARAAGAQIVVVAIHAGSEYQVLPNDEQKRVFAALTASPDIDLVYGHHAHVVQPLDKVNGKWVAYGLGNMVANQHIIPRLKVAQAETLVEFTFTPAADGRYAVIQVLARPGAMSNLDEPRRYVDLATLLADPDVTAARKAAYQPLYAAAVKALTALRADEKGLLIAGR